ncbi:MAG TPA: DnaA/Hda family protein [Gemmatimonadaceae bacterium]|nr:DnaA/Hda family protein [Gemmatimonadaceae bacterium]
MELDARYRFDNFIVGSANRLAVSAARAVAQSPGATYNPLFIYSSSGLGKTHIMLAIANYARQIQPDMRVEYSTVDEFVNELTEAVAVGSVEAFRQRHQRTGMLLLDDMQFLAGRRETQSEMLRLFDALQRSGTQVVFTSDRPPSEIADLDERLITRFSGGLVVDVAAPDYETRVAILRMWCEERGTRFEQGVLEVVARIGFGNVRELQGALNRLVACQSLTGTLVTPASVNALLGERAAVGAGAGAELSAVPGMSGEFASFLSDVTEVVSQHLESWRGRVVDAVNRWRAIGFETATLERLLESDVPGEARSAEEVDATLARYEAAAERLRVVAAEAARVGPGTVPAHLLRDPERLAEAERALERATAAGEPLPGPCERYSRANFEVGPSNQLAVHAMVAVIEEPGARYNPLFVHGGAGVGKTHLLNALGNELLSMSGGSMRVACVDARDFVEELIEALGNGTIEQWRARYRAVDVLMLDDVQACVGKERTQEELFHLFNGLYSLGRQMVFSADRAPTAMSGLDDRLRSRFAGGLVAEIQSPDDELRRKLFASALAAAGVAYNAELVDYLSSWSTAGAAELRAMVEQLAEGARAAGAPLDAALARRLLEGDPASEARDDEPSSRARRVASPSGSMTAIRANGKTYDAILLDREKVIWDWPEISGRAIEELR